MRRALQFWSGSISRLAAMAAGALACQFCLIWTAVHGTTPASLFTLFAGIAGGVLASFVFRRRHAPTPDDNVPSDLVTLASLTAVVLVFSWSGPHLIATSAEIGTVLIGQWSALAWLASTPSAILLALLVATVLVWCEFPGGGNRRHEHGGPGWYGFGAMLILIHGTVTLPMAVTCTCLLLAATGGGIVRRLLPGDAHRVEEGSSARTEPFRATTERHAWFPTALIAIGAGILIVAVWEVMVRLWEGSANVAILTAAMTSAVIHLILRGMTSRPRATTTLSWISLFALAMLPVTYSTLVEWNLGMNASGQSAWFILAGRAFQAAVFLTAAIVPLAAVSTRQNRYHESERSAAVLALCAAAAAWIAVHGGVTPMAMLAVGVLVIAIAVSANIRLPKRHADRRWPVLTSAVVRLSVVVAPLTLVLSGTMDSSRSTQLLFSARAVAAVQLGVDPELIPQSSAMRLIESVQTATGELSVWRRNGYQFEFRRNGIFLGSVSSDTQVCPQPPEDVLLAIIPLVLHPEPGRLLLLGDTTGACLRTCSGFPIRHLTAIRPDEESTRLAEQFTWHRLQLPPAEDERIRFSTGTSIAAIRTDWPQAFDVVIADSPDAGTAAGPAEFTMEFYAAARRQLTGGGIFCQRFRQNRFGSRPLQQVLATLAQSFRHAAAIQTVPGEVVLVATDAEQGLFDDQVLARLQRSHARRELATAGWDWCQVGALPMLDARDPLGMFAEQTMPRAVSISNARFALSLPVEALRSTNKSAEQAIALAPHQTILAAKVAAPDDLREMNRRISALAQQVEILCGMPDQPFVYRRSLRMELQQNPRPPVEVIRDGDISRSMHPLDKLRTDYFVALGQAIEATAGEKVTGDALLRLNEYTTVCEPLLSYFAHYELIRLYEAAGHPDVADEFAHRMHVVYFAEQRDASVRPVIAALELLTDHDSLVHSNADRFDQLNSMVQKLIERWEARTAWEPKSAIRVQYDVDASIHAVNAALTDMEQLSADAGVSHEEFIRRRRYVNAALIAPLRNYREQVLAHRAKSEQQNSPVVDDGSDLPLLAPVSGISTN